METMSSPAADTADLLDLKFLPAWVKEPVEERKYDYVESEDARGRDRRHPRAKRATFKTGKKGLFRQEKVRRETLRERGRRPVSRAEDQRKLAAVPPEITVRFLPYSPAFDSVVAQIKSTSVAYSLFALARLFLEKPERYQVRLIAKAESPLYRLGENGAVSLDRDFLDRDAFRFAQEDFYRIEITQSEPIKGNFSNVARCKLSGTLLGPTNYHSYQPRLRSLYERRFSRQMSFTDYQRNIEIVSDPALLERWKEDARKVITFATSREESPATFQSAAEAERHLPDRRLNRVIEEAWTHETRSPSNMIQELAAQLRQAGLNVFRHRRGMLFVSTIRTRRFVHDQAGVSPSVNAILEALAAKPGINRKELAEKLTVD